VSGALKRDEWETVRLGDVGEIITGKTPKTSEPENYSSQDICFYKPSDFSDESISVFGESEFYLSNYARPNLKIFPPNSVLVTCIGIIGKVGITKHESTCNQQINAIIPNHNLIDSKYLAYAIHKIKHTLRDIANSPVVPIINKSQFSNVTIPLPPLDIQRQIADTLDKVTELIDLRKKQLEKLDELVKARFVEMFGGISDSKIYPYKAVKELTDVISGGTPSREVSEYWEGGTIPWVKTTELQNNIITEIDEHITEAGLDNSSAKLVPAGTVLIAMYGQGRTRGMTGYLGVEACTNQACACILPSDGINQRYLWQYFVLSYDNLRDMAKGGNQPNLNGNIIKNYPILYPPMELQNQFVAFVEQADKSKVIIQQSLDALETLKKSLMQEYFG